MTEIRTIQGIPQAEMADRGKYVSSNAPFIPYLQMTQGEFRLALLQDQAQVLAAIYPEVPGFKKAATMYENALNAGISRGVSFVGAIHGASEQQAAQNILSASKMIRPAAKQFIGRHSLIAGVRIGEEPTYTGNFDHDCVQYATKEANARFKRDRSWSWWKNSPVGFGPSNTERAFWQAKKAECETKVAIETILNDNMVGTSHHLVYKNLGDSFRPILGTQVLTKKILHYAGIGGLSNVAGININLMDAWAEAAIIRKNATIGAGPSGSLATSLSIAPQAASMVAAYNQYLAANPGKNPKFDKINGPANVGGALAVITAVTALVTAIGAAIANSAKMQEALNAKKQGALSTVQGYGTPALQAQETDFLTPGSSDNNTFLIGGALVAAYLLFNE